MKRLATLFLSLIATLAVRGQDKHWTIPDFAVVQYAGSIGYISAGVGYDVLKSKARFSTHFGTVPMSRGGALNIISVKLIFVPTTLTVWNRVKMRPVDIGLMTSYNYGNDFESTWPEGVHPKGYYWWNPAFRFHIAMESSVTYEFKKGHPLSSVTGYVEFNTNELYFVSFIQNMRTVSPWDIVKVGTGARIHF